MLDVGDDIRLSIGFARLWPYVRDSSCDVATGWRQRRHRTRAATQYDEYKGVLADLGLAK
jgi:hypothetical protein